MNVMNLNLKFVFDGLSISISIDRFVERVACCIVLLWRKHVYFCRQSERISLIGNVNLTFEFIEMVLCA